MIMFQEGIILFLQMNELFFRRNTQRLRTRSIFFFNAACTHSTKFHVLQLAIGRGKHREKNMARVCKPSYGAFFVKNKVRNKSLAVCFNCVLCGFLLNKLNKNTNERLYFRNNSNLMIMFQEGSVILFLKMNELFFGETLSGYEPVPSFSSTQLVRIRQNLRTSTCDRSW